MKKRSKKNQTLDEIKKIRSNFLQIFILLVVLETAIRFMICLSFTSDIYAFALAGIAIVFIAFYILNQRKAIKESYAVVLVLLFYFLTHYAYVMGSYKYLHTMLLWFVIIPTATRIYFSIKITIFVSLLVLTSIFIMIYTTGVLDVLHHYKEIMIDYYGSTSGRFIINLFYGIILLYNGFGIYYLVNILSIENAQQRIYKDNKTDNNTEQPLNLNPSSDSIVDDFIVSSTNQTIKDVRLSDIYTTAKQYIESSECYLDAEYSMQQLSIDLQIHRITLSQAFNKIGNIPFKDFLNSYRIKKAKELFLSENFKESNIKQTYLNIGFKYHTTFNRVFKKQEGVTPTEFIVNNRLRINDQHRD